MTTREQIVAAARGWIGTPYHHQASVKGAGCDCLGLIRGLWRELLGEEPEAMPAYTRDWGDVTGSEPLLAAARRNLTPIAPGLARPGDILVFRMQAGVAKHAGVITDVGHFIHAVEELGVVEVALTRWWRRRIEAAFSFPGVR
ncbi:NlpC/P60 family protein [Methyloceanibacter sp.]|uniref:NlpC/P60 family protein n=1 Tax=Methyloceanibacter sp. TaxID=1965321 RepID=UPI003D6D0C05